VEPSPITVKETETLATGLVDALLSQHVCRIART
jgi:hypothetical protein